jgi:hypothetical protein
VHPLVDAFETEIKEESGQEGNKGCDGDLQEGHWDFVDE